MRGNCIVNSLGNRIQNLNTESGRKITLGILIGKSNRKEVIREALFISALDRDLKALLSPVSFARRRQFHSPIPETLTSLPSEPRLTESEKDSY